MKATRTILAVSLLTASEAAYAQYVPAWLVAAALSPLLVLLLAIALGFVARSWRIGLIHVGLVALWVVLFVIAAQTVENDYVIWTPIVLYAAHAILVLALLIVTIAKRMRQDSEVD